MFIRRNRVNQLRVAFSVLLTVLVLAGAIRVAAIAEEQAAEQALRITTESIRRAAVQCYALEGIYPVNIEYLMENYGIRPDTKRFLIHYQYVADNLLPVITVLPINSQGG